MRKSVYYQRTVLVAEVVDVMVKWKWKCDLCLSLTLNEDVGGVANQCTVNGPAFIRPERI